MGSSIQGVEGATTAFATTGGASTPGFTPPLNAISVIN